MIRDWDDKYALSNWVGNAVALEQPVETEKATRVLIVKLGWTETLVPDPGTVCSLGDVLRSTPLLHLFVNDHVTWLTDERAVELLPGRPWIDELLTYGPDTYRYLAGRRFDRVINLECDSRLTQILGAIRFEKWSGLPVWTGQVLGHHDEISDVRDGLLPGLQTGKTWPEILFEIAGADYAGEPMILGGTRRSAVTHDVGFNIKVGAKWPTKAWPEENWPRLAEKLTGKYSFDHQRHLHNLSAYIDWVNSCRMLVTNDSLGMHIAMALDKKVAALFGPTSFDNIPQTDSTIFLHSEPRMDCQPCYRSRCDRSRSCMEAIAVDDVVSAIDKLLQ